MRITWVHAVSACCVAATVVAGPGETTGAGNADGEVTYADQRLSPEQVTRRVMDDPLIQRYREVRREFPDTVKGHVDIAAWCRINGLHEERRAHLLVAARLDPSNAQVQRALGRKLRQGRWMSAEEYADVAEKYRRANAAYQSWKPKLLAIRRALQTETNQRGEDARQELIAITDPLAIPALEEVLSLHSPDMAVQTVAVLGSMPQHRATRSLARHAVWSGWGAVRQAAIAELQSRDPDHFIPDLIEFLRPTRSGMTWLHLPNGQPVRVNQWQDFSRNYIDVFIPLDPTWVAPLPTGRDVRRTRRENKLRVENAAAALETLTGESFGHDQRAWWDWWGKVSHVYFQVPPSYEPPRATVRRTHIRDRGSCFVSGTPIWTRRGPVPIDHIQLGDLVLSVNPATGEQAYKPVIYRTVRPRTSVRELRIGDETISATLGHPFWVTGQGWAKVKDLEGGVRLRAHGGTFRLAEVIEGREDIAFNLEVAEFATYFVGRGKLLVHDNTPILDAGIDRPVLVEGGKSADNGEEADNHAGGGFDVASDSSQRVTEKP